MNSGRSHGKNLQSGYTIFQKLHEGCIKCIMKVHFVFKNSGNGYKIEKIAKKNVARGGLEEAESYCGIDIYQESTRFNEAGRGQVEGEIPEVGKISRKLLLRGFLMILNSILSSTLRKLAGENRRSRSCRNKVDMLIQKFLRMLNSNLVSTFTGRSTGVAGGK